MIQLQNSQQLLSYKGKEYKIYRKMNGLTNKPGLYPLEATKNNLDIIHRRISTYQDLDIDAKAMFNTYWFAITPQEIDLINNLIMLVKIETEFDDDTYWYEFGEMSELLYELMKEAGLI